MVKAIVPGSFCPAHLGHIENAKKAMERFGKVTIICSENREKRDDRWFTPEECKEMVKMYGLGENATIMTLAEFMETNPSRQDIVMVRGIRSEEDLEYEQKIMRQNYRDYGVKEYYFIIADEEYRNFSSTKARNLAMKGNIAELKMIVHPKIARILIERAREIKQRDKK